MWVMWKLVWNHLEIVLISMQDRSTVCTECTKRMKSLLAHLMELLGDVGRIETHFRTYRDSVNLDAR
jgi:hypothetical protein